ncbi:MAG: ribosomal RNA small subunit methyltransferase A [Firmicutes bacterium]|nr:ribosomal RNA small subunit methyltransferase A [Bacillota bacterium]
MTGSAEAPGGSQASAVVSARNLRALLLQHGIRLRKRYGQNFLVDPRALEVIVRALDPQPRHLVLEIGPGAGALTAALAARAGRVVAVEVDTRLEPLLHHTLRGWGNVDLVWQDVLEVDLAALAGPGALQAWHLEGVRVAANLPYYITSPVLERLLKAPWPWERAVLTVQKEVAERLMAPAGSPDYSALGILAQVYAQVERVAVLPPHCFWPPPDVHSAVVRLSRRSAPQVSADLAPVFFRVVRSAFQMRRKTLRNALLGSRELCLTPEEVDRALHRSGMDGGRRGETLTVQEFATLAAALTSSQPPGAGITGAL